MGIPHLETLKIKKIGQLNIHYNNTLKLLRFFYLNISCIKINAIFTKSTLYILNILLSNTGEYQDNRPIQRGDGFQNIGRIILPLEDRFVRKLSEGGVCMIYTIHTRLK